MKTFIEFYAEEDQKLFTKPSVSTIRRRALREDQEIRRGKVIAELEKFTATVLNSPFLPDSEKRQAHTARLLAKLLAVK
jgi:hypothetical protein